MEDRKGVMLVQAEQVDHLNVEIYANRRAMGAAAAHHVADRIRQLCNEQAHVTMVFAAAPSQNEFLALLAQTAAIA